MYALQRTKTHTCQWQHQLFMFASICCQSQYFCRQLWWSNWLVCAHETTVCDMNSEQWNSHATHAQACTHIEITIPKTCECSLVEQKIRADTERGGQQSDNAHSRNNFLAKHKKIFCRHFFSYFAHGAFNIYIYFRFAVVIKRMQETIKQMNK